MRAFAVIFCILFGSAAFTQDFARAEEPQPPRVDQQFSAQREQRILQLQALSTPAAFQALQSAEFIDEEACLDKAIYTAFNARTAEALQLALQLVASPQIQDSAEGAGSLFIAKRIFQVFPEQSVDSLLDLYTGGGPKVRANVIYAIGQVAGGQAVKSLLIDALSDTSSYQSMEAESMGQPLRVCDAAYNQLVIRYQVKGVLRTIGTTHKIELRDYHIRLLLEKLQQ